eukprot:8095093-Alexandrium_andersonii.AAC.1
MGRSGIAGKVPGGTPPAEERPSLPGPPPATPPIPHQRRRDQPSSSSDTEPARGGAAEWAGQEL